MAGGMDVQPLAPPAPQDIAQFERLSDAQRRAMITREIQNSTKSAISQMTMEDICSEAMCKVSAQAHGPEAL
jgi:hypothetical protein